MRKAEEAEGDADVQNHIVLLLVVCCDGESHNHNTESKVHRGYWIHDTYHPSFRNGPHDLPIRRSVSIA